MCVHIPKGTPHTVEIGDKPLSMWTVNAPGGMEECTREIGGLQKPDPKSIADFFPAMTLSFLSPCNSQEKSSFKTAHFFRDSTCESALFASKKLSLNQAGKAAELILIKGRPLRGLKLWIALANNSWRV